MDTTADSVTTEATDDQRYHDIYNRFYYFFGDSGPKENGGYFFAIGPGWLSILEETLEQIDRVLEPKLRKGSERFEIVQIKEKFGGLRLYYDYGNSRVEDIVRIAERRSFQLCESCGSPGRLHERGSWVQTYCEPCGQNAGYSLFQPKRG